MKKDVKKNICIIGICMFIFCFGFGAGYLFNGAGNKFHQAGAAPDVRGYGAASARVEHAAEAVADTARNVSEASGEVKLGIDDAGRITKIAGNITSGAIRAADGVGRITDGIHHIMGILGETEKRNTKVEAYRGIRMD